MKDYVFEKPLPFVTEGSENSKDKTYKYLSRGMGKVFGNDQRNVVYFAFGLGIPGIFLAFVGLFMTGWGHPVLMLFDVLLFTFVCWVAWSVYNIYDRTNKYLSRNYESDSNDKSDASCS